MKLQEQERRGRGRPRSDQARRAILRAARELIRENGLAALTMEGIAAKAGVGKPTVYRWWPDRHAVAMAALMEDGPSESGPTLGEGRIPRRRLSTIQSLEQHLKKVIEVFAQPVGRTVARMIAAADDDSELSKAFRNHFIVARREEGRALLLRAIELGEIRADLDVETALDMIYGALFFRLLLGHAPLNEALARQIVSEALRGMRL
jgi:AcrR family transcriptional regulator